MDLDGFIAGVDPRTMFVKNQQFCTSLAGNPLPLLTITALPKSDGIRSYEEAVEEMSKILFAWKKCCRAFPLSR